MQKEYSPDFWVFVNSGNSICSLFRPYLDADMRYISHHYKKFIFTPVFVYELICYPDSARLSLNSKLLTTELTIIILVGGFAYIIFCVVLRKEKGGEMNKRILITFLYFFISCSLYSFEKVKIDGNIWKDLSRENKAFLVTGLLEGIGIYRDFFLIYTDVKLEIDLKHSETDLEKKNIERELRILRGFHEKFGDEGVILNINLGTIQEGIDEFYKDYANRHILVRHAYNIVNMKLSGKQQEEIEKKINLYRNIDKQNQ